MAGRGRAAVLPAWMKAAGATPAAPGSTAGAAPAATTAAAQAASQPASTPAQSGWSEHTAPDGRKYYYNSQTKQSSWTKPPELEGKAAPEESKSSVPAAASDWKEYTAPDGRKYYYNAKTKESRWEMPAEMRQEATGTPASSTPPRSLAAGASTASLRARSASPAATTTTQSRPGSSAGPAAAGFVPRPGSIQPGATPHYATVAEAKDAFKQMLSEAGASSADGWAEVSRAVMADRRFSALRTLGERKAAFNEYIQQRRKEEADAARLARLHAKEAFYELLDGCTALTNVPGANPTYARAQELLSFDARWTAVGSNREREDLFADWADERQRVERERERSDRRVAQAAFRKTLEAARWLDVEVSWRKACDRLEGDQTYEALEPADRLAVFKEIMTELEERERERKVREREERARVERANRAAFRELLAAKAKQGLIHARSRWREVKELVIEDPAYVAVEGNTSGSRPRELFEDLLMDLEDVYLRDRDVLKQAVAARGGIDVTLDSTFEAFIAALNGDPSALSEPEPGEAAPPAFPEDLAADLEKVPELSRRLYFEELLGKAKDEEARRAKQARYRREDFTRMLKHDRRVVIETTFEEAAEMLKDEPEWKDIESDEEKKELFEAFIEKLKSKEEDKEEKRRTRDDESDDERREKRRHKHKKKRHHGDSDDEDGGSRKHRRRSDRSSSRDRRRSSERHR